MKVREIKAKRPQEKTVAGPTEPSPKTLTPEQKKFQKRAQIIALAIASLVSSTLIILLYQRDPMDALFIGGFIFCFVFLFCCIVFASIFGAPFESPSTSSCHSSPNSNNYEPVNPMSMDMRASVYPSNPNNPFNPMNPLNRHGTF